MRVTSALRSGAVDCAALWRPPPAPDSQMPCHWAETANPRSSRQGCCHPCHRKSPREAALAPAIEAADFATSPPALTVVEMAVPIADDNNVAMSNVATAHARKPCAVSRKKTSFVCTVTQRERNRPARYPPSTDASSCTKVTHTMVETLAAVPEIVRWPRARRPRGQGQFPTGTGRARELPRQQRRQSRRPRKLRHSR